MQVATNVHLDLLDRIDVASPCPMKWDDLEGDGAVRHCGSCDLNVHNFSEMTREEVETLIANRDGRLCGAFYRRADGTILTKDCPVGLRAARIRVAKMVSRVAAVLGLLVTGGFALGRDGRGADAPPLRRVQPFQTLSNLIAPPPPPAVPMIVGDIMIAPPTGGGAGTLGSRPGCGVDPVGVPDAGETPIPASGV